MPRIRGIKRTIFMAVGASLLSGCFSLNQEKGNVNSSPQQQNTEKPKGSIAEATPTPAPMATPAPAPSVPQNVTERIKFGKGREGASVKGEVTANGSSNYTLGAREGQMMNIEVTSAKKGVSFDLVDKKTGDTLAENVSSWSEILPSTGDYAIKVYSTKGGDTYTLKVSIADYGDE
jgi:hypothetical protein